MIDKQSTLVEDIFRRICKEKKKTPVQNIRLTKGKLKAFLSQKYKGYVAQRVVQFFDFSTNYDYEKFIDEIENFLNYRRDTLMKMAFSIYDFD